jgi:hypothetical protein
MRFVIWYIALPGFLGFGVGRAIEKMYLFHPVFAPLFGWGVATFLVVAAVLHTVAGNRESVHMREFLDSVHKFHATPQRGILVEDYKRAIAFTLMLMLFLFGWRM